jgi:hypothetical protein
MSLVVKEWLEWLFMLLHAWCFALVMLSRLAGFSCQVSMSGQARQIDSKDVSTVYSTGTRYDVTVYTSCVLGNSHRLHEIRVVVSTPAMPFQTISHYEKLIPTFHLFREHSSSVVVARTNHLTEE